MWLKMCVAALLVASLAVAAGPIGKVSSAKPFLLSGTEVPAEAIAKWPLVSGDEIVTLEAPVQVDLRDGSRVWLMAGSRARVSVEERGVVVRLQMGALRYRLASGGETRIAALDSELLPSEIREARLVLTRSEAYLNPISPGLEQLMAILPNFQQSSFARRFRITPANLDFVTAWRQYEPSWGTPPYEPGRGIEPPYTPPSGVPKPVSAYRP